MKIIIGLGNPGREYEKTRHNIGKRLIEAIALRAGRQFKHARELDAVFAEVPWDCEPVVIAYPESYMNVSGGPVAALVKHFGIESLNDLLIVVDDIALPFGRMRLRAEGSSGGHNGLGAIEQILQSSAYARLRIGIGTQHEENPKWSAGAASGKPLHEYVLSNFTKEEELSIPLLLEIGAEACRKWAIDPLEKAVQWINSVNLQNAR